MILGSRCRLYIGGDVELRNNNIRFCIILIRSKRGVCVCVYLASGFMRKWNNVLSRFVCVLLFCIQSRQVAEFTVLCVDGLRKYI